jgi:sirohydrochlorin ferrochelatase
MKMSITAAGLPVAPEADAAPAAATRPPLAVVVAHGAPSDPEPLDLVLRALAGNVAVRTRAKGIAVRGATLARPGSLEAALAAAEPGQPVTVYPFFMSDGFFTRRELRRRVGEATANPVTYLPPFGLDPGLPALCIRRARETLARAGHEPSVAVLILAAHGSRSNPASAEATRHVARQIADAGVFHEVRVGFVEEAPSIAVAADGIAATPAVCLPLFATSGGHVEGDIPDQLDEAGFRGVIMPPIGEDPEISTLIADAIR